MKVSDAVARRASVRAFLPDPVAAEVVSRILAQAARAPSGGNLQPWQVYALAGEPLAELKAAAAANPLGERPEYAVYPPDLAEPFVSRRARTGRELYGAIGVAYDDLEGRARQHGRNGELFGAPVGLFFCLDRRLGPPQWADVGMYMQTVMLLAIEAGLDTCPQEYWSRYPVTLRRILGLPDSLILFSGMALGRRDPDHPLSNLRAFREPVETWCELRGFSPDDPAPP